MSTLSIAKSRNTKSAAPKKGSGQSKTASRRKVTSPAANMGRCPGGENACSAGNANVIAHRLRVIKPPRRSIRASSLKPDRLVSLASQIEP